MTKLLQRHEAAEMVGVTRQTIQNWIDKGVIESKRIGKTTYVSMDAIKALTPDMKAIDESRRKLLQEKEETDKLLKQQKEQLHDIKTELRILPLCMESVTRKEFYLSIIDMLGDQPDITSREQTILRDIMDGYTMQEIGDRFGLTRERIRQIASKTIRKAAYLTNLNALQTENTDLKNELQAAKSQLTPLQRRIAELEERLGLREAGFDEKAELIYQTLVKPVREFNLSVRAINVLLYLDVETVGDLVKMTRSDLTHARNCGKKSLREIEEFLESLDLHLGYDVDRIMQIHLNRQSCESSQE